MTEDTNTVRLRFKNYEFEVAVDVDTYKRISSDETYKHNFARQTYESLENDGHFINDDNEDQGIEVMEEVKQATIFKWTKPAIDLLIKTRFAKNNDFNSPKTRKSELWNTVARILSVQFPGVTGEMCDAKYRNLLHTYKLNKQRECRNGGDNVKWEYFDQFDKVLGLQINVIDCYDSIFTKSNNSSTFNKQDLLDIEFLPASPASDSDFTNKSNKDFTVSQYLRFKAEHDVRSLKLKSKIWQEKKLLKKQEIAAILKLAKALKSK